MGDSIALFVKDGSWADLIVEGFLMPTTKRPTAYIVLDTTINEAVLISARGMQTVRLDAPLRPGHVPSIWVGRFPNRRRPASNSVGHLRRPLT